MIYAYITKNDNGDYIDDKGTRYIVNTASKIFGKKRDCWAEYESLEEVLNTYKLTKYIYPQEEEEQNWDEFWDEFKLSE